MLYPIISEIKIFLPNKLSIKVCSKSAKLGTNISLLNSSFPLDKWKNTTIIIFLNSFNCFSNLSKNIINIELDTSPKDIWKKIKHQNCKYIYKNKYHFISFKKN